MPDTVFAPLTVDTAPAAARGAMTANVKHFGYLADGVARMAASPQLLDGFLKLNASFQTTSLDRLAREVMVFVMANRNRCHLCVAMHTKLLTDAGADDALIAALRAGTELPVPELEALRQFTFAVLDNTGAVRGAALDAFLAHGYTEQQALEVVLGIGAYTLSTLANRMTGAELDEPLVAYA